MTHENSKEVFGSKPGDLLAMLNAFDQLDADSQAQIFSDIAETGDATISGNLVKQELAAQGIAESTGDSLEEARRKARSLSAASEQIPGIEGLLNLLANDGREIKGE